MRRTRETGRDGDRHQLRADRVDGGPGGGRLEPQGITLGARNDLSGLAFVATEEEGDEPATLIFGKPGDEIGEGVGDRFVRDRRLVGASGGAIAGSG